MRPRSSSRRTTSTPRSSTSARFAPSTGRPSWNQSARQAGASRSRRVGPPMASPPSLPRVCRSAASTTSTRQSAVWAARRCRCRTACRWRKPRSPRARTSKGSCASPWDGSRMPDINMPKLSDTMEEGTVVEWKKKSGDPVKTGEVLAEVESDKATFDLEAESDGVLQILVEQGVPAKIGSPIAKIGEGGGQAPEPAPAKQAPPPKEPAKAKPKESETPSTMVEEREPAQKSAPPREAPSERPASPRQDGQDGLRDDGDVKASPLARRL